MSLNISKRRALGELDDTALNAKRLKGDDDTVKQRVISSESTSSTATDATTSTAPTSICDSDWQEEKLEEDPEQEEESEEEVEDSEEEDSEGDSEDEDADQSRWEWMHDEFQGLDILNTKRLQKFCLVPISKSYLYTVNLIDATLFARFPLEIQNKIAEYIFAVDSQPFQLGDARSKYNTIHCVYDGNREKWSYAVNTFPRLRVPGILGEGTVYKIPTTHLRRAPKITRNIKPFPYFDYENNLLSLEVNICSGKFGSGLHDSAIEKAIEGLKRDRTARRHLRHLRIVMCYSSKSCEDVALELAQKKNGRLIFRSLRLLEFVCHGHPYDKWDESNMNNEQGAIENRDEGTFPFKIEIG